jgi:CheY-like chemotaxis protein
LPSSERFAPAVDGVPICLHRADRPGPPRGPHRGVKSRVRRVPDQAVRRDRASIAGFDLGTRTGGIRFSADRAADSPEAKSAANADQRSDTNARHILLAEDNQTICEMLRLFLEGSGYRVTAVPTVQQAVAVLKSEPIDLLLSDFRLKDGTAWELMEQAKRVRPVPAVMLSGYSDKFYIDKSKAAGFADYLVKPVEEEQLLAVRYSVVS